jgi:uncharacterized membrane protein YuzA (DUF378 family)
MGIQEIIAFTIVGLAAVYIARLFISKSTPNKKSNPKCSCCEAKKIQPVKRDCKC